jgi:hypothetical protein
LGVRGCEVNWFPLGTRRDDLSHVNCAD